MLLPPGKRESPRFLVQRIAFSGATPREQLTRSHLFSIRLIIGLRDIHMSGTEFTRNPTTFGSCKPGMLLIVKGQELSVTPPYLRLDQMGVFSRANLPVSGHKTFKEIDLL